MNRKAEQAEATRRMLLEVATSLFSKKGYEDTSIEDVLQAAGVSKGALYHHFPNKESLFEAVFRETAEHNLLFVTKKAIEAADPLQKLRNGCQAWLDLMMDPSVRRISCIDGPAVLGWAKWRAIDMEFYVGMIKHVLQGAKEAGQVSIQNVDLAAHLACAMLGEAAMIIAEARNIKQARRDAGEAIDRMIDAIARA